MVFNIYSNSKFWSSKCHFHFECAYLMTFLSTLKILDIFFNDRKLRAHLFFEILRVSPILRMLCIISHRYYKKQVDKLKRATKYRELTRIQNIGLLWVNSVISDPVFCSQNYICPIIDIEYVSLYWIKQLKVG